MKRLVNYGALCLITLYSSSTLAAVTPNVFTCAEFKSAIETGQSIYLGNDIDCQGGEINVQKSDQFNWYDNIESPVVDGNGHTVSNVTYVTRTGLANGNGITRDINFDGIYFKNPVLPFNYNPIVASTLSSSGGYISNVSIKNIDSNEPLTGLFDKVTGAINGLTVDLGDNVLVTYGGVLASRLDGYISNLSVANGELSLTGGTRGMLSWQSMSGSYTNISVVGLKVTGSYSSLGLIADYLGDIFVDGLTYKNIEIDNPAANVSLVVTSDHYKEFRVINFQHDFWSEGAKPLYPEVLYTSKAPAYYVEAHPTGTPTPIPQECSPYLKQDFYWVPQVQ